MWMITRILLTMLACVGFLVTMTLAAVWPATHGQSTGFLLGLWCMVLAFGLALMLRLLYLLVRRSIQ